MQIVTSSSQNNVLAAFVAQHPVVLDTTRSEREFQTTLREAPTHSCEMFQDGLGI
jgi:hypothetical protein